jgi:hypothetical protein
VAHIQNSSIQDAGDVELFFPGDRFPVVAGATLRSTGWRGGLWVMYATGDSDFTVEVSDGNSAAGFLLFASEDYSIIRPNGTGPGSPENWVSHQFLSGVGGQNVATMVNGGTRAFFKVYETVALSGGARTGGAITYTLGESLKVSENGLLCNDSDGELSTAGVTTPIVVGIVSAIPSSGNGDRLAMDMKY